MPRIRRMMGLATLLMGAALLLAACTEDEPTEDDSGETDTEVTTTQATNTQTVPATAEPTEEATAESTETATTVATGDTVEVTGVDYAFEGVPATVAPGTELVFTNASEGEVHEIVLFRLPEGEERPLEELLQLSDEEANAMTGAPLGVAIALPGQDGMVVEGNLVVEEAGRYVMICGIPVGADPAAYEAALQNPQGGPPEVEGGPPHLVEGMAAEFRVE